MLDIQKQYNIVKNSLKEKRFIHTLGVVSTAKKLAKLNDVSIEKAEIAALSHDIAKNMPLEDMKKLIDKNNIILSEDEKITTELWHSILAPIVAKKMKKY